MCERPSCRIIHAALDLENSGDAARSREKIRYFIFLALSLSGEDNLDRQLRISKQENVVHHSTDYKDGVSEFACRMLKYRSANTIAALDESYLFGSYRQRHNSRRLNGSSVRKSRESYRVNIC